MATSRLHVDPESLAKADKDEYSNAFARIENHYFINNVRRFCLLTQKSPLLVAT